MNEQNSYYAFISYNSTDEKWAKWLQHNLEYYHIPSALCKEYPELPKKIRPVFWYKQDLSGTKLKKALNNELSSSKYLIVICSPDSAKADWVNDEVVAFIEQGKGDRIIPFIVAGTPHAKNPDEECFPPALRNLTRDEEIRGIDVRRKEGKYHALVDVIATMFGVRFDVLWQRHERRRKRIRNIWITVASVFLLCALGIYDYTRTKVEYYADWVDCNGVAQGVIPLSDEQYSHRCASYKFEYTRVPFGEKGFYSWRLNKVSLVNSKGVVSSYTPDNHAFFYPIQEYKYTDGYVTEIINRDTYNRVVMRYTIKDDYDHKVACLVDMEGKEKHQGSAYLSGSTTAFLSDANPNMSKIKRFHYTRNEKGYITKVTYHANDADELDESAIGDNNNIYGKLFDLDEFGRVTKVTYINHEGNPMTDKYGVGYIRYSNAGFEENDTTEYLGSDGKLAYNEHRFARQINILDKYGNPIESCNEGTDGKPCYDYKNIFRQVVTFDENGCFTEIKYYDFDGNLSYCSDNYAIQRVKYDSKGRWVEVVHYDVNDKPCYTKNNYSITRARYDAKDRIIEQSFYDINGKPCVEKVYGTFCIKTNYDEYNYIVEQSVWGSDNKPSISPSYGFHLQKNEYDDYHRLIKCISYDTQGNRCINTQEYCCEGRYTYDTRGNLVKIECIDTEGKPCICKDGYATITYKVDIFGNKIEECYWGIQGEPVYINMCSSIQYDYYPNGLIKEDRYYDENGKLCLNKKWYAISRYEWNNNGLQTKVSFFDTDTVPCYYKDGLYSCMEFLYDNSGNIIKEIFYDSKGNTSLMTKGLFAIAEYKFDNYRHIIEYSYFNEKGQPCYYDKDYHILRVKYDLRGNVTQRSIYGVDGKPTLSREGSSIIEYKYDSKNNIIRTDFKDITGNNINQRNRGYSTEVVTYDNMSNIIRREYYDMHGKPCMINAHYSDYNMFFSSSTCKYDNWGNCIEFAYYDVFGKATKAMTYAFKYVQYDICGRVIEEKYKQSDGKLAQGGNHHMAILRYKYNKNSNYVSEVLFYDTDSIPQAHLYQTVEKGHITRKEIRDKDNKLKSMYISGFTDIKCAIMTDSLNVYGLNIKRSYYDENGKLGNTEEGIAILRNSYDQFGRITLQTVFDKNDKPVCGITMKFHKRSISYNEKGLVKETAYFDENNHYVNTPLLQGYCKEILNYDERGDLDRNASKWYYSVDGKAIDEKELNNQANRNEDKKVAGSLILANVELPGLFRDNGYEGLYCIIEWNEWTMYDDIEKFSEVFSASLQGEKHLLIASVTDKGLGKIIDVQFSPGTLGIRIMDGASNSLFNDLVDTYEQYKKSKKRQ